MKVELGLMVVKNGKAWSRGASDGQATYEEWVSMENGDIFDPRWTKVPTDATYPNSPFYEELSTAKLVAVERKTTVTILDQQ